LNLIDSGGHFNPAVTLSVFIAGGIQLKKALLYVLMQLIGGAMAAGIFRVNNYFQHDCLSLVF
jgi:glycerol uptake facilitator-like aquaporin